MTKMRYRTGYQRLDSPPAQGMCTKYTAPEKWVMEFSAQALAAHDPSPSEVTCKAAFGDKASLSPDIRVSLN